MDGARVAEPAGSPVGVLRALRGWSRERLAAEAGVSLSTVWRTERGQYPRVEHLIAIAEALGVSTDAVLGRSAARTADQAAGLLGSLDLAKVPSGGSKA